MKEVIAFIKKIWANKRYRSLVILGMYFIFFGLVFLYIYTPKNNVVLEPLDKFKNITSYSYEISGKDNFKVLVDGQTVITYNDNTYTTLPDNLNYDLSLFEPISIYNLIKRGTLESTNYVEHSNTYLVDNYKITTYEKNTLITKIVMCADYTLVMDLEK
ncbi:MAG: hypothetical protein RSB71_03320 [Bacilli bacterium]